MIPRVMVDAGCSCPFLRGLEQSGEIPQAVNLDGSADHSLGMDTVVACSAQW
jgi:hypothetical protein